MCLRTAAEQLELDGGKIPVAEKCTYLGINITSSGRMNLRYYKTFFGVSQFCAQNVKRRDILTFYNELFKIKFLKFKGSNTSYLEQ